MSVIEFAEKVKRAALEILGDDYKIEVQEHTKINETKSVSVNITCKDSNLTPVIYVEPFYEEYENGVSFGDVMNSFVRVYRQSAPSKNFDMDFIKDFNNIKDKICMRVLNFEKNSEVLESAYYTRFLDLAVVYYMEVSAGDVGSGHIMIKKSFLEKWNIKGGDILKAAIDNADNNKIFDIIPMESFFMEFYKKNMDKFPDGDIPKELMPQGDSFNMWIVTNKEKVYGATALVHMTELSDFASDKNSNLFIIPSSVHEIIIFLDDLKDKKSAEWKEKCDELKSMIFEVNRTELSPGDFLSDNLYYFDRNTNKVAIV
ncbi:MAG: DUF5688 family protein [Lachnospiraceae bacterium]|nr:DUF5688 family protein [Lachnospiraceae bacterium]